MALEVRRIVTGHDSQGKAVVATDERLAGTGAAGRAGCVGGTAARVGRSFARLLCCPVLTERGRKKAPWLR